MNSARSIRGFDTSFMREFVPHVVKVLNRQDDNKNEIRKEVAIVLVLALYKIVPSSTIENLVNAILDSASGRLGRLQIVPRIGSPFNIHNFVTGLLPDGVLDIDQQKELALASVKYMGLKNTQNADEGNMQEVTRVAAYLELKGNNVSLAVRGALVCALFNIKPAEPSLREANIPFFADEAEALSQQADFPNALMFVPAIVDQLSRNDFLSSDVRDRLACALLPHEPAQVPDLPVEAVYGLTDYSLTVEPLSEKTVSSVHAAFSSWMLLLDNRDAMNAVKPSDYHHGLAINALDTMIATMREVAACLITQPDPCTAYHALHFLGCLPSNIGGGEDGLNSFIENRDFLAFRLLLMRYVWWQIHNNLEMPHETYLYLHRIFELAIADVKFTGTTEYGVLAEPVYKDWGSPQLIGMQTLLQRQSDNISTLLMRSV